MNFRFQIFTLFLALTVCGLSQNAAAQNDLQKIEDGKSAEKWLISNEFPAEIDAGAWENFNRFNIENLPAKDWLAPFGGVANIKPQAGTFKAQTNNSENPKSQIPNPKSNEPLPEVGAQTNVKVFPDATEISWREVVLKDSNIDFYALFGSKTIGTAYAASYINSSADEIRFLETDGFLGAIWLNGKQIYNGFSLNVRKVIPANFQKGQNILLVRASGVSGDYWRKNGGWSALIRFWKSEQAAQSSAIFKPSGATGTIFYLEGFHVDPVYLHDQRGYAKITLSNTVQYLRNLRSDPRYGVYLSEIDYLKPYLDTHPEDREFLRETVKNGRVGAGGAYNQFNENTIGGESIIRNILYGQAMHNVLLGRKSESLALWDVFGHSPQISQIAAKSGFTGIVWSKKITGFNPFFYDYALDGSRLLHRRVDYAYSFSGFGSGKNYTLDNFRLMTERKFAETQSFNAATDLRINAADFTPPWTNLAGNVAALEAQKPQIRVTGQAQDFYFRELNKEIADGKVKPPISSRDKLFFHVGVNMARSDLKIGQRVSENITLTAEKFGSIAYLLGAKYPDLALDKAWRQIFFGSHHDAITGTPSDNALLDLVHGYREAFELSKDALDDSLKFIAKQVKTKTAVSDQQSAIKPIIVFNSMNWTRTDVVKIKVKVDQKIGKYLIKDSDGKVIKRNDAETKWDSNGETSELNLEFIAENVPSIGYKNYYIEVVPKNVIQFQDSFFSKVCKNCFIENDFYKITVDRNKGGAISSIFDKQAQREIINSTNGHFANEIASLKEELTKKNVIYPAWEMWTTGEKTFSTEQNAEIVIIQKGNAKQINVFGEFPNKQKFHQTITLNNSIKRIDFKTELIDYKGKDELFVVNFPLNLTGGALVTEDRFGTVVRNSSKGFLDFRTNTDKLVSGAPVYSVNNWAEYGSTFNLNFVNEGGNPRVSKGAKLLAVGSGSRQLISSDAPLLTREFLPQETAASVPFKPTALVRPHGEIFENLAETLVSNLIKRGVSVTPFYDDNDAARRKNLTIEDSTMPKNLNDDIAYHNFRIALGTERENVYSAKLLKQVSTETRAKFDARLQRDGFAFLFLYDAEVPQGWAKMPTLLIAANDTESYRLAVEEIVLPIYKGAADNSLAVFPNEESRREYKKINPFSVNLPFECFAAETNPNKDLPRVPDYGVALINNGTAGVSLENGNVLTMFLTHTATFPGVNLPFEFVPEHKTHIFNYSLYPHAKDWREADTVKVGYDANNPLMAIQTDVHEGSLPSEFSFLKNNYEKFGNIVLTALKLGENPQASFQTEQLKNRRNFILRFNETEGQRSSLLFTFSPHSPAKNDNSFDDVFWLLTPVDLLENEIKDAENERPANVSATQFKTGIDGFAIDTFKLRIDGQVEDKEIENRQQIGATKELIQPVFSRYWLHNAGAAPIGNDAVKVSLRPVEQMGELSTFGYDDQYNQGGTTTIAVRVQVVNNYQDRRISGEVALEVPEDWRVVPASLKYDIAPNGSFVQDVAVITFPVKKGLEFERASGLVKAKIEHDGQTFQDVINLGKPFNLEWTTEQTATGTIVKIKNPYRQTIEGAVALITPPEAWFFNEPKFPREIGFSVAPDSETILKFETGELPAGTWRIARITYNGNTEYKRADGK